MKILGYIWQVIVGLITIGFVLGAYSIAGSSSHSAIFRILISGLVIVLVQLASFMRIWAIDRLSYVPQMFLDIREIKQKLDIPVEDDVEVKDALASIEKLKKKAIVPLTFTYILWVIAVLNILIAIVG